MTSEEYELMILALTSEIGELQAKLAEQDENLMFLEALKQSGVDNWDGCCDAWQLVDEWMEEE